MATTTIQAVSVMSTGKTSSPYPVKAGGLEGANSFQNLFLKSAQSEKAMQAKSEKAGGAVAEENPTQTTTDSKPEARPKPISEKSTAADGKTTETGKQSEKTELSAEEQAKLKAFVEKVQKTLGLNADELQMWMNVLGVGMVDLLQPTTLQHFFMQVSGVDVSRLLTDQDQMANLKELIAAAGELQPMLEQAKSKQMPGEFEKQIEEAFANLQAEETKAAENVGEGKGDAQSAGEAAEKIIKEMPGDSGKAKEQKPEQAELPKEAVSAFQRVVVSEQQVRITADGLERVVTTVNAKDIFEQVVTKFTAVTIDGTSKVTMQLNPEHLGKIAFQVVSREGQLTGQFVAESEAVKAALEAQVSQLKLHLANHGIRVEDVKVLVGDTANYFTEDQPKEQHQESTKKRGKRLHDGLTVNAVTEETSEEEITISTGTVDFTA